MKKKIYLDNSAATKIDKKVKKKMIEVMEFFGNPSAMHKDGREAKKVYNNSKKDIAKILNCNQTEIIFTSSGTESDNLAIFGAVEENKKEKKHIITTKIEHHAVLYAFEELEKRGFKVTYLDVKKDGKVNMKQLKEAICQDTFFISIMYANNEIGTIQDIKKISKIIRKENKDIIFHTDACQAINYLDIDVQKLDVDLMSFSGSKIYGPKGIGVLYKNKNIKIKNQIFGGGQEMGLRSGTENIFLIAGIAEALKITEKIKEKETKRLAELQKYFIENMQDKISDIKINGSFKNRLVNNVNVSFDGIEGESILLLLDEYGIAVSTGSACASSDLNISHVLAALDIESKYGHGSIRFSFGRETTKKDLNYTLKVLEKIIKRLRSFSPIR